MALKTVYVELVAKTKRLLSGFQKVDRQTSKLNSSFKKLGVTLAGVFGARALSRGLQQTIRSTESLIKTAKGVGFTVSEYERLTFALSEVGVEASSARIALGDFQKRLSKAIGGSSPQFAKAFKEAGLDIRALSNMSPAAAFDSAFAHLAGMLGDPRIAGLFGNVFEEQSGKDMLKAARQMERLLQARRDYDRIVGQALTREDALAIQELGRQTRLLGLKWEALKRTVVADVAPSLTNAFTTISESEGFKALTKNLGFLIGEFNRLVDTITWVAKALDKIQIPKGLLKLVATPGLISPQGVLARAFKIEDVLPNVGPEPGDLSAWFRTQSKQPLSPPPAPRELDKTVTGATVSKYYEIKVDATGDSVISRRNAKRVGDAVAEEVAGP